MEICKKCGSLMVPSKTKKGIVFVCKKCKKKVKIRGKKTFKLKEKIQKEPMEDYIPVVEKRVGLLPITTIECSKCGNRKAEWWTQQTRASDEPETRFYRCVKCKHTWREYS